MSQDNMNGHTDPTVAAALSGQIGTAPVNAGVVQVLSDMLDRARRGEINGVVIVGARASDMASFDAIALENMALAMILLGSMQVVAGKIVQGARESQQQVPSSRIVRPPAGMKVG